MGEVLKITKEGVDKMILQEKSIKAFQELVDPEKAKGELNQTNGPTITFTFSYAW